MLCWVWLDPVGGYKGAVEYQRIGDAEASGGGCSASRHRGDTRGRIKRVSIGERARIEAGRRESRDIRWRRCAPLVLKGSPWQLFGGAEVRIVQLPLNGVGGTCCVYV